MPVEPVQQRPGVQRFAADALWELWFRGGTADQTRRLREAAADPDAFVEALFG